MKETMAFDWNQVIALTGAGISVSAGIPTYEGNRAYHTSMANTTTLAERPGQFLEYYKSRVKKYGKCVPTTAHKALAHRGIQIITQNVDDLHEKAGSENVIHLHGQLNKGYCMVCAHPTDNPKYTQASVCERCSSKGKIRPDVVLFGENVPEMERAIPLVKHKLLLVIGTSLQVYPAADLVEHASYSVNIDNDADSRVPVLLDNIEKTGLRYDK